jgi:hypothetical protein
VKGIQALLPDGIGKIGALVKGKLYLTAGGAQSIMVVEPVVLFGFVAGLAVLEKIGVLLLNPFHFGFKGFVFFDVFFAVNKFGYISHLNKILNQK